MSAEIARGAGLSLEKKAEMKIFLSLDRSIKKNKNMF